MNEYLKDFLAFDEKSSFYIQLAGITYPDPTYRNIRLNSQIAVIEYIVDGRGYVILDGEVHSVCKDTIYFLPQGMTHSYYADEEEPFTKIFLNVSGGLCDQLITAYGLSGKYFFGGNGLKPLFEQITAVIHSDLSDNEMQSRLQGLFVEIISRLSISLSETRYSAEALKLKKHIDANPDRMVSSEELSKLIFRSPDYCRKLFLREFDTTPYSYQLERKMQKARFLLVHTNMPINEISESLGYSDFHYFSNLFLKKCGCRPKNYRNDRRPSRF